MDIDLDEIFENMKKIMKYIIDIYGVVSMRYGVIFFVDFSIIYVFFF